MALNQAPDEVWLASNTPRTPRMAELAELSESLPYRSPISVPAEQLSAYKEFGYAKVEGVLTRDEIAALGQVCDEFYELARTTTTHTDVFDLEPGHTPEAPKVRRVKNPALNHPLFRRMVYHPVICGVVEQFFGEGRGEPTRNPPKYVRFLCFL